DFALLPFISCDLGAEQPLEANDVLGLGREPAEPSRGVITDQGQAVVPIDLHDVGLWLKGLMGPPTTTGTTPAFVHVFTSGAASLPSLSLELGFPEVPRTFQNLGCLVGSIKFPWAVSGRANTTITLIGQGETTSAATIAGTPTTRSLRRFQQSMGFIRKDGAALGLVTAGEITYDNKLDPVRVIREDGKIEGCDLGVAACSGQISVRFADTTLLDAASAGTPIALSMGWTLSTDQALIIDLPAVYLPRAKRAISGPNGIEARTSFQAAKPASGPFVTITLKNDVESYA
ncbi:phage tail tube protein, partial [Pelagibius sp.]|uniref:phage tail tube protein n=1 Tax=Pelagibius sp. TaxID=1931238 RepID=UPI002635C435